MKRILVLICLCILKVSTCMAQCNIEWLCWSTIEYDERTKYKQLTYDDFKLQKEYSSYNFKYYIENNSDSLDYIKIFQPEVLNYEGEDIAGSSLDIITEYFFDKEFINFAIFSVFILDSSYMKSKNEETLLHEQIHFNLAEINARKIKMELCKSIQSYTDTVKLKSLFANYKAKLEISHAKFDKETLIAYDMHGFKKGTQLINKRWMTETIKELNELESYSMSYGKIRIRKQVVDKK